MAVIILLGVSTDARAQFGIFPERPVYEIPKDFSEEGYKRIPPVMPPFAAQSGHCKFDLKVGANGTAETINIESCTDSVFEEETRITARQWQFRKSLVGDVIQQTMTFRLSDEKGNIIPEAEPAKFYADDIPSGGEDAEIINVMYPPKYPWHRLGTKQGYCCVDFSVSQIGTPFDVDVRGCTDPNFKLTAEEAVRWRQYTPATLAGKNVSVSGHQTSIDFYKVSASHDIQSDIFGNIPVPNVEDTKLGVCRPNS